MNQDEINQSEWKEPDNWSALCYRSRVDSRFVVPKRRGFGWTLNSGHKYATAVTVGFLLVLFLPVVLALLDISIKR